jgi:hypothetical protein
MQHPEVLGMLHFTNLTASGFESRRRMPKNYSFVMLPLPDDFDLTDVALPEYVISPDPLV